MVALLLVPLVTIMGVATQTGGWFLTQRAMQNAADSAVIAAATNGGNGGTDYVTEAKSVTADYGFTNGSNNVTVTVPAPTKYAAVTSCASSPCYNVKVTMVAPLYLLELIGYTGNAASSGGRGQALTAGALATTKTIYAPFCLVGLRDYRSVHRNQRLSGGQLGACNIFSNSNSKCNGHSITSAYSDSGVGGAQTGSADCGGNHHDNQADITDPYSGTTATNNIIADIAGAGGGNHCTGSTYYPESNSSWPSGTNRLSGAMMLPAVSVYCGDVSLGGNVQITSASPGSVIIIENGMLDLNNYQLQSLSGSGVSIIFYSPQGSAEAYTSGGTPTNFVCATSRLWPWQRERQQFLDISSPTSGTWSGIALFQDMNLPLQGDTHCSGNDKWDYSGSSPTWDISGVVDLSRTDFCVSGAINKATNGFSCLTLVDNSTHVNGTGNVFYVNPQSQCAQQGVTQITAAAYVVGELVY